MISTGRVSARPEELGKPENLLADRGYFSAANVAACEKTGIEPLIAMGRQPHHPPLAERFEAAPEAPDDPTPVEAMAHRLKTPAGRALYALRKQMPEPVFGIIKSALGFRQFSLRGLAGARAEWSLVTMAWNIKRLFALASPPDKAEVRRLGRQAPGNAISGPSTAFCTRPNAPTLLRPAKTILGDQPQ